MTTSERVREQVVKALQDNSAAIDATPALSSVTVIVQVQRYGPLKDKVIFRTESGHATDKRRGE